MYSFLNVCSKYFDKHATALLHTTAYIIFCCNTDNHFKDQNPLKSAGIIAVIIGSGKFYLLLFNVLAFPWKCNVVLEDI